jgi:hypothetical protein
MYRMHDEDCQPDGAAPSHLPTLYITMFSIIEIQLLEFQHMAKYITNSCVLTTKTYRSVYLVGFNKWIQ